MKKIARILPDSIYLKLLYRKYMNKKLDLKNPTTFNEKLQWLKLHDRKDIYTSLVDKYEVRKYISKILGEDYLIPLIGVWDSIKDIDKNKLPNQFVLKCTHDSGGVIICKNKENFDFLSAFNFLDSQLKKNYYDGTKEWPYKNIKPRIIAEKYMENENQDGLIDYKFFCFDGYVDCVMVCIERQTGDPKFYFFDKNWKLKRLNIRGKNAPQDFTLEKPKSIDKMFDIASKLSKDMPFVRIDLYENMGHIYFGEFTFYPQSGLDNKILEEADIYFGNLIDLKKVSE